MPLIQWPSAPTPVTISALATGVTEGKLETQSGTSTPRSIRAPKVGRAALGDRAFQHVGAQRVDVGEDQLLGGPRHRRPNDARTRCRCGQCASRLSARTRRPACLRWARRRRETPSQPGPASTSKDDGRDQDRDRDDDQGGERDEEAERAAAAALAAAGAELTTSLTTRQAKTAPTRQKMAPAREPTSALPASRKPTTSAITAGEDRHPATGGAVRAGGAGEHPDRDADAELEADAGERSHAENLTPRARVDPPDSAH